MERYEKLHRDTLHGVLELVSRLSREPGFALICAHAYIELLISILVEHKCKNGKRIVSDWRTYPHSAQLVILNEMGLLADPLFQQLDYLRRLRNECAHTPLYRLTDADIKRFKELGVLLPKGSLDGNGIACLLRELIRKTWKAGEDVFSVLELLA